MLKYIVIQLAEDSISYCHYSNIDGTKLMSERVLKQAIHFALLENLQTTFVYPKYPLPENYHNIIDSISHTKIVPVESPYVSGADIIVIENVGNLEDYSNLKNNHIVVLRVSCDEIKKLPHLYNNLKERVARVNIIVTDIDRSNEFVRIEYESTLRDLGQHITANSIEDNSVQLNLISDRLYLTSMNNCNAGDESVVIMPNGKFYPCPGFYNDDPNEDFGDLDRGLDMKNQQLYRLDHAPICSHCDAYQCRRCVWLNRKLTLEINTPSKEQCVWSHIERNVSGNILKNIREKRGESFLQNISIPDINYVDPFDNRNDWI